METGVWPPIEIEKRECPTCKQQIVVMDDGTLGGHRYPPAPGEVLGPWCKRKARSVN